MNYPKSIQNLIESFSTLPTVGRKTAERFVFYLLKQDQNVLDQFADAMQNLKQNIKICQTCGIYSNTSPCEICSDTKRDRTKICVIATNRDMLVIENTKTYSGLYHVLGSAINTIKGITPEQLNINPLLARLQSGNVAEVILALNPNFEGETTAMYLQKLLQKFPKINYTRLARGLPTGADIEYADEATLSNALKYRQ